MNQRLLRNPESRLLLLASRECASDTLLASICEELRHISSAERLVRQAVAHGTFPLVYATLRGLPQSMCGDIARETIELLRAKTLQWLLRRTKLNTVQEHVCGVLNQAGVRHIVLRGLRFAQDYYLRPELRHVSDIDLFVPEATREEAVRLILAEGFIFREPPDVRDARARYMGQTEFLHAGTGIALDLNWRLTGNAGIGPVPFCMEDFWERTVNKEGPCRLSYEDELLLLIQHFAHGHDFVDGLLRCCVDLHAVFRKSANAVNWNRILASAREVELLTSLVQVLSFYFTEYCQEDRPESETLKALATYADGLRSSSVFRSRILGSELRPCTQARNWGFSYIRESKALIAKLWAIDSYYRVFWLLRIALWPSGDEAVLLTRFLGVRSHALQVILCITFLWLLAPAILLGIAMRLLFPLPRSTYFGVTEAGTGDRGRIHQHRNTAHVARSTDVRPRDQI